MKLLIAYASKSGTAKKAAEELAAALPNHTVTLADLAKEQPDPTAFDYAVVGGSIRMGKAYKPLRRYLASYSEALAAVPHTLFLCCAFPDQLEHYAAVTYPTELRESAEQLVYFGGELNVAQQKGIDRLLTRMMRNAILNDEDGELTLPGYLPEHVRTLADALRKK